MTKVIIITNLSTLQFQTSETDTDQVSKNNKKHVDKSLITFENTSFKSAYKG